MRWLVSILTISLCAAMMLLSGCGSESKDLDPPEIRNSYEWGEFYIGGKTAILYADQETANVAYTNLVVYFPNGTPSNPDDPNTKLVLNAHLEDIALTNVQGTIFEDLPVENYILGGPVENPVEYNSNKYIFTTSIAPYVEGSWSFEFVWESTTVNARAFMPIEVTPNPYYRAIIAAGSWKQMVVLAWIEPRAFRPGPQPYRIKSWRSENGGHVFNVDSTLTIELSVSVNPSSSYIPDTSIAKYDGGSFIGNITLPPDELVEEWKLKAITFDDTIMVAEAYFNFETSPYKGD